MFTSLFAGLELCLQKSEFMQSSKTVLTRSSSNGADDAEFGRRFIKKLDLGSEVCKIHQTSRFGTCLLAVQESRTCPAAVQESKAYPGPVQEDKSFLKRNV
mgnify:CR=1 FL=1